VADVGGHEDRELPFHRGPDGAVIHGVAAGVAVNIGVAVGMAVGEGGRVTVCVGTLGVLDGTNGVEVFVGSAEVLLSGMGVSAAASRPVSGARRSPVSWQLLSNKRNNHPAITTSRGIKPMLS